MLRYRPPKKELLNFTRAKNSTTPMAPEALKAMRKGLGLTQAQFAAQLKPPVTRASVVSWEKGYFRIPDDLVERMGHMVAAPAKPTKRDRATLETYAEMRGIPNNMTHSAIIAFWISKGFTPSVMAQQMIADAFPDILEPQQTKG
jgi:DNA-binding transcriptional regulator YiaG